MNKKGFLLAEETLKIIIALISLGFLVYFLGALYFANQDSKELEQAKASLEFLVKEINDGREEVTIFNPSSSAKFPGGWILISFPLNENVFPDKCNGKECVCICDEALNTLTEEGLADDCDNVGVCLESDFKLMEKINLENPPITLQIKEKTISR